MIHFWKTSTRRGGRIDFLPMAATDKITEGGGRNETVNVKKQTKKTHLSSHGSALCCVHAARSDPTSPRPLPGAPAGPRRPESTTSGTSSSCCSIPPRLQCPSQGGWTREVSQLSFAAFHKTTDGDAA